MFRLFGMKNLRSFLLGTGRTWSDWCVTATLKWKPSVCAW